MSTAAALFALTITLVQASQVESATNLGEQADVLLGTAVYLPIISVSHNPPPIPREEPILFAVIGDYGTNSANEAAVADLVHGWPVDFVITTGDNNYNDGDASTIDENIGKYYSRYIYPYQGSYIGGMGPNQFFPSPGNHDWRAADLRPYRDYFPIDISTANTGSSGNERYYDFVQGPVHFFVLDSDGNEPDGNNQTSTQALWLKEQLAKSSHPWQVVYFHHPPFSSGLHGSHAFMQWPFAAWGADAVLSGHDHTYERLLVDGIPYYVNGLGGASIYNFGPPVSGSEFRYNENYGAMLVEATETFMTFEFYAAANGGELIDRQTILADGRICSGLNPTTLIAKGANWRYLDDGSDLETDWNTLQFDDSAWLTGTAVLGFGDSQPTTLQPGHISYYFRQPFTLTSPLDLDTFKIEILRDDGAVVYLNGVELFRTNMPSGTIVSSTLALEPVINEAETQYVTIPVVPGQLLTTTNVLAVEVHQVSQNSSDSSFDLAFNANMMACSGSPEPRRGEAVGHDLSKNESTPLPTASPEF